MILVLFCLLFTSKNPLEIHFGQPAFPGQLTETNLIGVVIYQLPWEEKSGRTRKKDFSYFSKRKAPFKYKGNAV
jgi:hypothetical protein